MGIIAILIVVTIVCSVVICYVTDMKHNPTVYRLRSRHGKVTAVEGISAAIDELESFREVAHDGDVCCVRYIEDGAVKVIAGVYSKRDGVMSVRILK